jgi:hypothetical protein
MTLMIRLELIDYKVTKINANEHHGTWTRGQVLILDPGVPVRVRLSYDKNEELEIKPNDVPGSSNYLV